MTTNCLHCIDGFVPAGALPILGPLYMTCTACQPACGLCDGMTVYPADHRDLIDFVAYLADLDLIAVFCPGCWGVEELVTTDDLLGGPR